MSRESDLARDVASQIRDRAGQNITIGTGTGIRSDGTVNVRDGGGRSINATAGNEASGEVVVLTDDAGNSIALGQETVEAGSETIEHRRSGDDEIKDRWEGQVYVLYGQIRYVKTKVAVLFSQPKEKENPVPMTCPMAWFNGIECVPTGDPERAEYDSISACVADPDNQIYTDEAGTDLQPTTAVRDGPPAGYEGFSSVSYTSTIVSAIFGYNGTVGPESGSPIEGKTGHFFVATGDHPRSGALIGPRTPGLYHLAPGTEDDYDVFQYDPETGEIVRYSKDAYRSIIEQPERYELVGTGKMTHVSYAAGYFYGRGSDRKPPLGHQVTVTGDVFFYTATKSPGIGGSTSRSFAGQGTISETYEAAANGWLPIGEPVFSGKPEPPPIPPEAPGTFPTRPPEVIPPSKIARQYYLGGDRKIPELVFEHNEEEPSEGYITVLPDGEIQIDIKVGMNRAGDRWCKIQQKQKAAPPGWQVQLSRSKDVNVTPSSGCLGQFPDSSVANAISPANRATQVDLTQSVRGYYYSQDRQARPLIEELLVVVPQNHNFQIDITVETFSIENITSCALGEPVDFPARIYPIANDSIIEETAPTPGNYFSVGEFRIDGVSALIY